MQAKEVFKILPFPNFFKLKKKKNIYFKKLYYRRITVERKLSNVSTDKNK